MAELTDGAYFRAMEKLAPLAAIIAAPTLAPGPNNIIVMALSTSRGLKATVPSMVAIAAGSAIMLGVVTSVAEFYFIEHRLSWIAAGGSLALAAVATWQWIRAGRAGPQASRVAGPAGLVLLQWVNPNSWILVVVVAASANTAQVSTAAVLALLVGVSIASSLCWALFGGLLARVTRHQNRSVWLERLLAAALFAAAANIFFAHIGEL